jgi:hypothetical protein
MYLVLRDQFAHCYLVATFRALHSMAHLQLGALLARPPRYSVGPESVQGLAQQRYGCEILLASVMELGKYTVTLGISTHNDRQAPRNTYQSYISPTPLNQNLDGIKRRLLLIAAIHEIL